MLKKGVSFVQVGEVAEGLGSGLVADHAGVRVVLLRWLGLWQLELVAMEEFILLLLEFVKFIKFFLSLE